MNKGDRNPVRLKEMLKQLAALREQLDHFGVRDSGDYAEILVAKALDGARNTSVVEQGFDVTAPEYGRVEVRSRTLPFDGRRETRVQLSEEKRNRFAWLAGIVFTPSLDVHAAYLLPHDAAWELAARQRHARISLDAALAHPQVRDITAAVHAAEHEV